MGTVKFAENNPEVAVLGMRTPIDSIQKKYTINIDKSKVSNTDISGDLDELEVYNNGNKSISADYYRPSSQLIDNGINGNNNKVPSINPINRIRSINNVENYIAKKQKTY